MLEESAEYHTEEARLDEVVGFYGKLPDRRRLCEDVHYQVMRCLAQSGDGARGTKQFEGLRGMLSEQLGAEPSADTLWLYEDLLGDYA